MPTYEWRCRTCGAVSETFQSMEDASIPHCVSCKKPMTRVFSSIPFVFREGGSGARKNG